MILKHKQNPYKQKAQNFTVFSLSFLETNENPEMRTLKNRITNLTQSERMGVSPEDDFD